MINESFGSKLIKKAEARLTGVFAALDENELINTQRVLKVYSDHAISQRHFAPTNGYGYDDVGRDTLDLVWAEILGAEKAIVRPQIASGTHALALCLYAVLRPGDTMIGGTGKPYDTLKSIIGSESTAGQGSLKDYGVNYREIPLKEDHIDIDTILQALSTDAHVRLVHLQRSRGYDWRDSFSVFELNDAIDRIHQADPSVCVMVDNCYGEFTDTVEPHADLIAGSFIKNPGGGIAPTGGYAAGKAKYVDLVGYRLTCPGLGTEIGSYAGSYQPFYQGIFMAPHTVNQALKVACLTASTFDLLGFNVNPAFDAKRNDIVEAIRFENPDLLIEFCRAIQANSPIDGNAVPEPWDMPGYDDQVIMAAGTFVAGASVELSADAPMREPYIGYLQGGLTYVHGKLALIGALDTLKKKNLL